MELPQIHHLLGRRPVDLAHLRYCRMEVPEELAGVLLGLPEGRRAAAEEFFSRVELLVDFDAGLEPERLIIHVLTSA